MIMKSVLDLTHSMHPIPNTLTTMSMSTQSNHSAMIHLV